MEAIRISAQDTMAANPQLLAKCDPLEMEGADFRLNVGDIDLVLFS